MGVWGTMPWDNDGAADWFDNLFNNTKLAKYVEDTLKLDPAGDHEEIRAAASILLFLGRNYIWPVRDLDRHLALAADRLEEINRLDVITESPELVEQIRVEIQELHTRVKKPDSSQPPATPPVRKWWQFWS
jgi:hypothetical protein